ncbi:hypothetical protein LguiB_031207 [Lonicera macranthoides]
MAVSNSTGLNENDVPHLNINLQMNYWPLLPCSLSESQEPLFDHISFLSINGSKTAKHCEIQYMMSTEARQTYQMHRKKIQNLSHKPDIIRSCVSNMHELLVRKNPTELSHTQQIFSTGRFKLAEGSEEWNSNLEDHLRLKDTNRSFKRRNRPARRSYFSLRRRCFRLRRRKASNILTTSVVSTSSTYGEPASEIDSLLKSAIERELRN